MVVYLLRASGTFRVLPNMIFKVVQQLQCNPLEEQKSFEKTCLQKFATFFMSRICFGNELEVNTLQLNGRKIIGMLTGGKSYIR